MDTLTFSAINLLEFMSYLFIFAIGATLLWLITLYIIDKLQTKHAIRHNYPVIGRLRYFFEHLGTFFRQYFFAMDREELPFNRAERSWVYQAAKNVDSTVAFGSTRDVSIPGTVYFANCMYPTLEKDAVEPEPLLIGPHARIPYQPRSFFNISGMSFGALSVPAIKALSRGAKLANIWLNTGEGGLSPYHLEGGCDIVFQIGTAKFGVRDEQGNLCDKKLKALAEHEQLRMFEIKLSQGAKPGKGGILPGKKVTEEVSRIRGIPIGQSVISPNRFPEVETPEDLIAMIHHIREISGKPTGIKLCVGAREEIEALFVAITKKGAESAPDFITIDSAQGGSGAAPMSLIDNVGLPIRESLPMLVDLLNKHNLRKRIRVIASGKLINPADVAWALCAGADFINNARGFMFSLGCIQALQCNKDTCPTGVTTHNKRLQAGLNPEDKYVRVANYAQNMEKEVGIIAHSCGVTEPRQLTRHHARIVMGIGQSRSFSELYPEENKE
jgi:glutamate synthase domain-containing protein 2